jgi:hypothetical protein
MEDDAIHIPIAYENTEAENLNGMYIIEQLIPLDDRCFSGLFEAGSGIYKITVFGDSGDGLAFSDLCDTIANYFSLGTHTINEHYSVCIDEVSVTGMLYGTNEDKVQKSINIEYRKFFNK